MERSAEPAPAPAGQRRSALNWALYDWANSAFATTGLAGLFPVFFKQYFSSGVPPANRASEFFGFYNMLGKSAAIIGPLLMALVSQLTGRPRLSILALLILLAGGGVLLLRVDEHGSESREPE